MVSALDNLWSARIAAVIRAVEVGTEDHREIASLYEHISDDYGGRFLIELLQNASDQADKAGLTQSSVGVIRTKNHVYVTNEGVPFDEGRLKSMTTLGLSPKDPGESIGNKGVGFKSVRQVSDRAEIISAPDERSAFATDAALRFAIDLRVGALDTEHAQRLRSFVRVAYRGSRPSEGPFVGLTEEAAIDLVISELAATPAFRFPLPLDANSAHEISAEIGERLANAQTVVRLRLLPSDQTQHIVERALDELFDPRGTALLFLPAVTSLHVDDRVRKQSAEVSRNAVQLTRAGKDRYTQVVLSVSRSDLTIRRRWHVVSHTLGSGTDTEAVREQLAIHEAAATLPGRGWNDVRTAPVAVALPEALDDAAAGTPLAPDGLFVIGLPTHKATGTPFWVDARFHGKIARTEIDLVETQYNALLLREAQRLVRTLVETLRNAPRLKQRRLVTQAMNTSAGELAEWMKAPNGVFADAVVLASDGRTFLRPVELVLPAENDVDLLMRLCGDLKTAAQYGYVLPELVLLRNARGLIADLCHFPWIARGDPRWLARSNGGSLIEHAALRERTSGRKFWETFLDALIDRYDVDEIKDHRILPVGTIEVASPSEGIFYAPSRGDVSEDEVSQGDVPDWIARELRFLDEAAVKVRVSARVLTTIGRKLTERELVNAPRLGELISDAIAPRLVELTERHDDTAALALLTQAVEWVPRIADDAIPRGDRALRVPCLSHDGAWTWRPATTAYFGPGWIESGDAVRRRDELLQQAYGSEERLLVPWTEFAARAPGSNRDGWAHALERLGVTSSPRVLDAATLPRSADLMSRGYVLYVNSPHAPPARLPATASRQWVSYLGRVAGRKIGRSRALYYVSAIEWIDGLESERARASVFELMLLNPGPYQESLTRSPWVQRIQHYEVEGQAPVFWADVLRHEPWPIAPSEDGQRRCLNEVWISREGPRTSYADAPQIAREFAHALPLLEALGVADLDHPSIDRAIQTLHEVARRLSPVDSVERSREVEALVQKLYEGLARACREGSPDVRAMLEAPVPLIVGTAIEAVGLDEVDVLYVDDAPDRRVFLTADERHPFLPATPRSAQAGLVTALRDLLGAGRVKYTSEASVETGFVPATPGEPLIDFLARNEGQRLRDVALLVAYGRHIEANPSHEAFQRLWRVFEKTTIRLGTFGPKAARVRCFFESQPPDGPRLDVAVPDNPLDVVRSLWMIFGEDARDPFAAYVTAVERGERDTFFDERGIRMLEEREIDAFLGTSDIGRLYSFRDAVFALWCRSRDGGPVDFETEWLERDGFDAVARWLEVDRERLSELARAADDEERLRIMQSVGVSLSAWQRARVRLGLPPIEFERGYREFDTLRSEVIWGLAAVAAHASGVNLDEAYAALAPTLANAPPAAIRQRPHVEPGDLMAVLQEVRERLQTRDGVSLLTARVDAALGEPSGDLDHFTISGDRRREVQDYRDIPEPLRAAWAHDALDSLLRVASALALHHTIPFTVEHVRDDPRIVQLTTGWWANRFAVLDAAQRSIRAEAGDVLAERLSRGRAFHDPTSNWRELWRKFPELGASPDEEEPDVSARIEIGGQELTHASAFRDLRQRGSDGLIAQRLRAAVDPGLSLSSLRDVERAAPAPGRNRRRAPGEPVVRVSKPPRNETPADRDLNGLIGEAFVFEQLRVLLEDFDDTAWISENRSRYGLLSGPNEQRYDFRYRDIRNALTLPGGQPECHIEVKATSGDGNSPFPMSVPEWEHAIACHHSREATYVVIRVADVRDSPHIADIILDPVALMARGKLTFTAQSLWIHVGREAPLDLAASPDA